MDFAFVSDRTGLGRKEGRNQNFFISPNNIKFQEKRERVKKPNPYFCESFFVIGTKGLLFDSEKATTTIEWVKPWSSKTVKKMFV